MTLSVRSALLPVWTQVEPPDAAQPYWREVDGERRHVHELVVGAAGDDHVVVEREHVDAIAALAGAAIASWRAGDGREARRLAHAAARLCEEIVGFWPASLNRGSP